MGSDLEKPHTVRFGCLPWGRISKSNIWSNSGSLNLASGNVVIQEETFCFSLAGDQRQNHVCLISSMQHGKHK